MSDSLTMSATHTIEPMRWWHLDDVAVLEAELFPHDRWSHAQFWSELAQPTRRYWVALAGQEVLGYAGLFVLAPDADVQTIAVAPSAQGRGLGRELLQVMITAAQVDGASAIMLEVRAGNSSAIALYEHAGFTRIHVRKAYYPDGEDALILRRELGGGAS